MKIANNELQYSDIRFKSTRVHVRNDLGRVINCHYTNFNRQDLNWGNFVKLISKRFKDFDKVNINLFGCSDGSEAYTLRLYLIRLLGLQESKKFEIFASDISPEVIEKADNGEILLHNKDLEFLNVMSARHLFHRDYNKPIETMRDIEFYPYKVSASLRSTVNFSVKDVKEQVKKHDFSNEIFSFRNGWAFLDLITQNTIVQDLFNNINEKTLCLIGQYDLFKSNACEFFLRNGFTGIKSVFQGAETDNPSRPIGMPEIKSTYPEFILFEKDKEFNSKSKNI